MANQSPSWSDMQTNWCKLLKGAIDCADKTIHKGGTGIDRFSQLQPVHIYTWNYSHMAN